MPAPLADPPIAPQPTHTRLRRAIHLRVRNDHASQTGTLTIKTPQTVDGKAVADRTHTLAASRTSVLFGPFPAAIYGDTLEVSRRRTRAR